MNATREQSIAIFNEWVRRYAEDPNSFSDLLDSDGKPFTDYGERATAQFNALKNEMFPEG